MSATLNAATCSPLQFPFVFVSPPPTHRRLPHPFVLHSSHFSLRFCLISNFSLCLLFSGSLFPLLIRVSSRQMAGLGVMVRCLGGLMAYRVEACTAFIQSEDILSSLPSATSPSSPLLSLHFLKHVLSLPDGHTHSPESLASLLGLSGVYICVCLLTEWGFCGERQPPEWGREQIGV